MKLLSRFVILAATFAVCTCNISHFQHMSKPYKDDYFCENDMLIPKDLENHCDGLREQTIKSYIARAVDEALEIVHQDCTKHVEHLCNGLPQLHKEMRKLAHKYCKEHIEEIICEYPVSHKRGLGKKVYQKYSKFVNEIVIGFETKKSDSKGKEREMCQFFHVNDKLKNMVMVEKCKSIDDAIPKTTCNAIMNNAAKK